MDFEAYPEKQTEGFNQPETFEKSQDVESRILFLERRVERILAELEKIREKPNVEQIIVDFLEDLEKIKKEWKKEEEKINFIKGFIEEFDRKIEEIRKIDIKGFEEKVEMLNQALKKLEEQKKMIEGVYDTIFSTTKPLNERITVIENEIKNLEAKSLEIKEFDPYKINELENRMNSLEEDVRKLGSTLSLASSIESKELEKRVEVLEKKVSGIELGLSSFTSEETKSGAPPEEIVKNFSTLNSRMDEIEKKIKLLEESFEKSLNEIKSSFQAVKEAKKAELFSLVEEMSKKISNLEEKIEAKKKAVPIVIE
ncbi:MAG: hypothetical protein QXQ69_02720 [Candidatus Aenigmatarchaeota archaeon]